MDEKFDHSKVSLPVALVTPEWLKHVRNVDVVCSVLIVLQFLFFLAASFGLMGGYARGDGSAPDVVLEVSGIFLSFMFAYEGLAVNVHKIYGHIEDIGYDIPLLRCVATFCALASGAFGVYCIVQQPQAYFSSCLADPIAGSFTIFATLISIYVTVDAIRVWRAINIDRANWESYNRLRSEAGEDNVTFRELYWHLTAN